MEQGEVGGAAPNQGDSLHPGSLHNENPKPMVSAYQSGNTSYYRSLYEEIFIDFCKVFQ